MGGVEHLLGLVGCFNFALDGHRHLLGDLHVHFRSGSAWRRPRRGAIGGAHDATRGTKTTGGRTTGSQGRVDQALMSGETAGQQGHMWTALHGLLADDEAEGAMPLFKLRALISHGVYRQVVVAKRHPDVEVPCVSTRAPAGPEVPAFEGHTAGAAPRGPRLQAVHDRALRPALRLDDSAVRLLFLALAPGRVQVVLYRRKSTTLGVIRHVRGRWTAIALRRLARASARRHRWSQRAARGSSG
mmetsp:Transcript_118051/g.338649  ORF Transcript_118051/g.338649 Transcript_118051/m.338649 type:complete len:243 (+) Transcript_118051:233-961(+)